MSLSNKRIKAYGRLVAGEAAAHPAFSASYDLVTDEAGATKRLSMSVTLAARERQLSVARDEEGMWLIQDHRGQSRAAYGGALDVDVLLSPLFNALPVRRTGIHRRADAVTVPVVYVSLPELTVKAASITYVSAGDGSITIQSPGADTTVTVDVEGFIRDYPGLAERI